MGLRIGTHVFALITPICIMVYHANAAPSSPLPDEDQRADGEVAFVAADVDLAAVETRIAAEILRRQVDAVRRTGVVERIRALAALRRPVPVRWVGEQQLQVAKKLARAEFFHHSKRRCHFVPVFAQPNSGELAKT